MRKCAAISAIVAMSVPVLSAFAVTSAHAEMLATRMNAGLCVDLGSGKGVLSACSGGGSQNFFNISAYGAQQFGGKCLQGTGSAQALFMAACNGSQDQQWLYEAATGMYRNKGGWCANISGGGANPGAQIISFACNGQANEKWLRGVRVSPSSLPSAQAATAATAPVGSVIDRTGKVVGLISNDGASIVAQGGGNIVAQGGGNIVAQGGGN
jgi:hypothetical protein